jgi:predicted Zn-dependent protease
MDFDTLSHRVRSAAPAAVDAWSARLLGETHENLQARRGVVEAPTRRREEGLMVTVRATAPAGTGWAHAATADLSASGVRAAFERAREMAHATASHHLLGDLPWPRPERKARPSSAATPGLGTQTTLAERIDRVRAACDRVNPESHGPQDPRLVDWSAQLWSVERRQLWLDDSGARTEQQQHFVIPNLQATAQVDGVTQTRSAAGQYNGFCQQGGLDVLERARFASDGPRVAREAIELAAARTCPSGTMPVLLMPDQMMLQIHESIGHPLELDRILGDERNFAGTSFVTLDLFGHYRWGSDLLNVSYDPTRPEQLASFAEDDDGTPAERQLLIEAGILKRPLGGALSVARAQRHRADIQGVATSRSMAWNRAPIDRMSNLNIEPGTSTLDEMIQSIGFGVLMKTNLSWSIDDSRNKFQFGCEWGQVIREGRLAEVVRNPNYRGVSATFWRSLAMVGNESTMAVMGTPFCGKGEPGQAIRVGHASPACLFSDVEVFGGDA